MRFRTFVALELPPELKQQLAEVQAGFRAALPRGTVRWVSPEGIHLTLKFYGDVKAERLPEIEASLRQAAAQARPISLAVEGLGVFPNPRKPQVIWAGLEGDFVSLRALYLAIEQAATEMGFPPEPRDFKPHLTIGRVNSRLKPGDLEQLLGLLSQANVQRLGEFRPDTLSLMRSEMRPTGSVYTRLAALTLGGDQAAA